MEKQTKYPNIEKFKAKLATQHENLEKQLKEVKEQYPLVVLAYAIQEATIAELSYPISIFRDTTIDKESATTIEVEKALCFDDLDRDIKRAKGDVGQATDAVEKFSNCWKNAGKH